MSHGLSQQATFSYSTLSVPTGTIHPSSPEHPSQQNRTHHSDSFPDVDFAFFDLSGTTLGTNTNASPTATAARETQYTATSTADAISSVISGTSEIRPRSPPRPHSTVNSQIREPPRNAEGKIVCDDPKCNNRAFTTTCDWKLVPPKLSHPVSLDRANLQMFQKTR